MLISTGPISITHMEVWEWLESTDSGLWPTSPFLQILNPKGVELFCLYCCQWIFSCSLHVNQSDGRIAHHPNAFSDWDKRHSKHGHIRIPTSTSSQHCAVERISLPCKNLLNRCKIKSCKLRLKSFTSSILLKTRSSKIGGKVV